MLNKLKVTIKDPTSTLIRHIARKLYIYITCSLYALKSYYNKALH